MNWKTLKVGNLRADFVLDDPIEYDFSNSEEWSIPYELVEMYERKNGDEKYPPEPMMNYLYPCPNNVSAEKMYEITKETAMTFVEVNGDLYMALAGCGMDFSWSIAKAYIMLGYLPPLVFCTLPDFAGTRPTAENLKIIAACIETTKFLERRAKSLRQYLRGLRTSLTEVKK